MVVGIYENKIEFASVLSELLDETIDARSINIRPFMFNIISGVGGSGGDLSYPIISNDKTIYIGRLSGNLNYKNLGNDLSDYEKMTSYFLGNIKLDLSINSTFTPSLGFYPFDFDYEMFNQVKLRNTQNSPGSCISFVGWKVTIKN